MFLRAHTVHLHASKKRPPAIHICHAQAKIHTMQSHACLSVCVCFLLRMFSIVVAFLNFDACPLFGNIVYCCVRFAGLTVLAVCDGVCNQLAAISATRPPCSSRLGTSIEQIIKPQNWNAWYWIGRQPKTNDPKGFGNLCGRTSS